MTGLSCGIEGEEEHQDSEKEKSGFVTLWGFVKPKIIARRLCTL